MKKVLTTAFIFAAAFAFGLTAACNNNAAPEETVDSPVACAETAACCEQQQHECACADSTCALNNCANCTDTACCKKECKKDGACCKKDGAKEGECCGHHHEGCQHAQ